MQNNNDGNKNILLAVILSAAILIAWTWLYEKPRLERLEQERIQSQATSNTSQNTNSNSENSKTIPQKDSVISTTTTDQEQLKINKSLLDQKIAIAESSNYRIAINSNKLSGSINLQGAKFDNLYLNKYKTDLEETSDKVTLFAPVNSKERYFADFGWVSSDSNLELPNMDTIWNSSDKELTPSKTIKLSWKNQQNIQFLIEISMDENYMFNISKSVENLSNKAIKISSYGRVNKLLNVDPTSNYVLHEGPIGVFDGVLSEMQYVKLKKENNHTFKAKKSWSGLTDKYWLVAIITENSATTTTFNRKENGNGNVYDVSFIGEEISVAPAEKIQLSHKLFAGAKEVKLLDEYSKHYGIDLFDRAVDFGWYYFLTKPFFFILKFFNNLFGNYGLAILAMTVIVKLAMLPLAAKSYRAMAKIKKLHPSIEEIKKNNKDNKMQMNKDVMALYKREGVNPAAGCLPVLIQIPVFFSLYKVLYVTIDMRHQPFFGWIKDLSAPDPTSIFNLFGLLPFDVKSGILMIGIWPILMGITMIIQQKLGPKIADPIQARVMKFLPIILIFVFAAFPAGLLIYWTWNNILSVIQQYIITKRVEQEK